MADVPAQAELPPLEEIQRRMRDAPSLEVLQLLIKRREQDREDLLILIQGVGCVPKAEHKQWLLDQVLRKLMGAKRYETFIANDESWDTGVAP